MEIKAMCSDMENSEANIERDLWAALLHAKGSNCSWRADEPLTENKFTVDEDPSLRVPYVWNHAEPEAEAFYSEIEQDFSLDSWGADEIAAQASSFFACLDSLWTIAPLQATLAARFATRIPQALIAAIADRAHQVLSTSASVADQLVQCVQDLLPNLVEDDLLVLARPLAYSMRDSASAVESTLERVRPVAWEELSDIEQARLSLAIARCALDELKAEK